jgi:AcrR family transcriptional regulator
MVESGTSAALGTRRPVRSRRTQEERRSESRRKLLEAAVESLCAVGFSGTTVAEIARRAGLSLGCLQHHFPEKRDLLAAAVEHVFEQHRAQLLASLIALPDSPNRALHALDLLWESVQSEAFVAYLELLVAARTDPALQAHVARTAQRMGDATKATFNALYSPPAVAQPFADVMPALVMGVLEGAMLGKIAKPHDDDAEKMVAALKAIHLLATQALGAATAVPVRSQPAASKPRRKPAAKAASKPRGKR